MRQTMTMRLCLVTLLALLTALWAGAAWGAMIAIDETNFPDPVFRAYGAATAGNIVDNGDGTYSCELSGFQEGNASVTINVTGGGLTASGYTVTVTPTTNGTAPVWKAP